MHLSVKTSGVFTTLICVFCALIKTHSLFERNMKEKNPSARLANLDCLRTGLHPLLFFGAFMTEIIRFITLFICAELVALLQALHTEVF